jgi:hypothetical protein
MLYEVRWHDRKLMISLAGYREARSHYYMLMYPLVWNPMLRADGHISFDDASGDLVNAYIVCADLLGQHTWFKNAYIALFGKDFWDACMRLVTEDNYASTPLQLTMTPEAQEAVRDKWQELYELAWVVAEEMNDSDMDVSAAQVRVMQRQAAQSSLAGGDADAL